MKKFLVLVAILGLALPISAQHRSGNIYGKVVDENGEPLPGVTITLTGARTAPMSTVSGGTGEFRFISLSTASDYCLTAELEGFKTRVQEGCIVQAGSNTTITLAMEMGGLSEEVTVTAKIPIVDVKKTSRTFNAGQEIMQSIPSARDTLSVFEWVPGITPSKVWVGTSNMGYMNNSVARAGSGSYWGQYSIDGVRLEFGYADHDMWEEVQVSMGGVDIKNRSGDIVTNLVTKRGGNKFSLQGRFVVTDEKFQAGHKDAIERLGVQGIDRIILNKDYGFNLGGPVKENLAWFWLGYAVQDSQIVNTSLNPVNHVLTTYNAKINLQLIPQNRIEIWGFANDKLGLGREASVEFPGGYRQMSQYHFGAPKGRLGIEHMFGDDMFVALDLGYSDSGYAVQPSNNLGGLLMGKTNIATNTTEMRTEMDKDFRPRYDVYLRANYFNDDLFGASHEIKFGFEYETLTYIGSFDRDNVIQMYNYNYPTVDITGDGFADIVPGISRLNLKRWAEADTGRDIYSAYVADTISVNDFNITVGVRYDSVKLFVNDQQIRNSIQTDTPAWQDNFTSRTPGVLTNLIPEFTIPGFDPGYDWSFISPRIGVVWDVGGRGTTTVKLSAGLYPAKADLAGFDKGFDYMPMGGSARLSFWWMDNNKDKIADYTEFYWHQSNGNAPYRIFDDAGNFTGDWADATGTFWSSYDPLNPTQTTNPTVLISEEAERGARAMELGATVEHELFTDFMVGVNYTFKRYDRNTWYLNYWPDTGMQDSNELYTQAGTVPGTVAGESTGDLSGLPYYLRTAAYAPTSWEVEVPRPDYNHVYHGVDFIFDKKFSGNWYLGGSFTLQTNKVDLGSKGYLNPRDIERYQGAPTSSSFARWIFKLRGLYKLPWDVNVSFMLYGREGSHNYQTLNIRDYNWINQQGRDATVYTKTGTNRLDPYFSLAFKLEKVINIADAGKVYIMLDLFNAPNVSTVVSRYTDDIGRWFPHNNTLTPYANRALTRQMVNPRCLQVGVRFQF